MKLKEKLVDDLLPLITEEFPEVVIKKSEGLKTSKFRYNITIPRIKRRWMQVDFGPDRVHLAINFNRENYADVLSESIQLSLQSPDNTRLNEDSIFLAIFYSNDYDIKNEDFIRFLTMLYESYCMIKYKK